jgi:hypothetical protein
MLNRGAVIVRPRQPFLDWAAKLDDSGLLPNPNDEQTVYLIPEYDDDIDALQILSEGYDVIFQAELEGWHTRQSDWPKSRTFAMFREWFDIEFHSVVEDLCDYSIEDDEGEA